MKRSQLEQCRKMKRRTACSKRDDTWGLAGWAWSATANHGTSRNLSVESRLLGPAGGSVSSRQPRADVLPRGLWGDRA